MSLRERALRLRALHHGAAPLVLATEGAIPFAEMNRLMGG